MLKYCDGPWGGLIADSKTKAWRHSETGNSYEYLSYHRWSIPIFPGPNTLDSFERCAAGSVIRELPVASLASTYHMICISILSSLVHTLSTLADHPSSPNRSRLPYLQSSHLMITWSPYESRGFHWDAWTRLMTEWWSFVNIFWYVTTYSQLLHPCFYNSPYPTGTGGCKRRKKATAFTLSVRNLCISICLSGCRNQIKSVRNGAHPEAWMNVLTRQLRRSWLICKVSFLEVCMRQRTLLKIGGAGPLSFASA